jgi:hypothetical protein
MVAHSASARAHVTTTVGTVVSKPPATIVSGTDSVGTSTSSAGVHPTCVLSVASTALRVTEVIGLWSGRRVTAWERLTNLPAGGFAVPPNARLLPNGTLQAQLSSLTERGDSSGP